MRELLFSFRWQDGVDIFLLAIGVYSGIQLIRGTRAVAMVGHDDELQAGARRRLRNLVHGATAIRAIGVNVVRATRRRAAAREDGRASRCRRQQGEPGQHAKSGENSSEPASGKCHDRGWNLSYTARRRASRICV